MLRSTSFALGLATTLALLGLAAGLFGFVYGQVAVGLPILVSLVAIVMGLNLLGILQLSLPSLHSPTPDDWDIPNWLKSLWVGIDPSVSWLLPAVPPFSPPCWPGFLPLKIQS